MPWSTKTEKKPKVVLDTNIIVSAALAREGSPAKIFEMLISDKIQNFTTKEISEEIEEVLNRKEISTRVSEEFCEFLLAVYKQKSILVQPTSFPKIVSEDPDDDKFVHCAIAAKADYIVSGDSHLLNIKRFENILILSPKEVLQEVENI